MSTLGLIGFINFLTSISLGLLVIFRSAKTALNRSYFALNLTIAFYSFGYFAWQFSIEYSKAFYWFDVLFYWTILLNVAYIFFVLTLIEKLHKKILFSTIFVICNVLFLWIQHTGGFYSELEPRFGLGFWPVPKFWLNVYVIFWHWSCFYGCYLMFRAMGDAPHHKKQQIKFVMMACSIGYLGGASNWLMWYGIHVPPYPSISISIYVGLIAYAIFRHKLMDFDLILRWGLAYSLLVLALFAPIIPLVLISEKLSRSYLQINPGMSTLLIICLIVAVFDPLRKIITRFVDQIIFRSPDFQILLVGIEEVIKNSSTLMELSDRLSNKLKNIWAAEHFGVALWDFKNGCYQLLPIHEFSNQIINRINEPILRSDFLVRTLETEKRLFKEGIVMEEELTAYGNRALPGERTTFWKIRRTMRWVGAAACVPLLDNRELLGFIILGKKKNNSPYSDEDKKFLSHVAEKITNAVKILLTNDMPTYDHQTQHS